MSEHEKESVSIRIREYQPADFNDVRTNLEDSGIFNEIFDNEQNLRAKIEGDPESILVAEADNQVVGNVFLVQDGWASSIFRLAVRKNYREQGIGSRLLTEAEDRLRQRGAKVVELFANDHNFELLAFYAKRRYRDGGPHRSMWKLL